MRWISEFNHLKGWKFEIEHTYYYTSSNSVVGEGFYLYVYESKVAIYDYLQDKLQIAKNQALEEFGVPLDSWVRVE